MKFLHGLMFFATLFGTQLPDLAVADITAVLRKAARTGAGLVDEIPASSFERLPARLDPSDASGMRPLNVDISRAAIHTADPKLLRQIDELAPDERELAMQIFEGGQILRVANPDELARARLITEGGADLLVAAHRHGDEVAKPAYILQLAEKTGQVPAGSVARFATVAVDRGTSFVTGWNSYIVPNWKPLVTAGVITACLAASETCIDASGNLVGHAAKTFTQLGIELVAKTTKGGGEAVMEAIKGPDVGWLIGGIAAIFVGIFLLRWIVRRILAAGDTLTESTIFGLGWLLRRVFSPVVFKSPTIAPENSEGTEAAQTTPKNTPRRPLRDRDL